MAMTKTEQKIDRLDIPDKEKAAVNEWLGFFSYKPTWIFKQFIHRPERIIGLFWGNRGGKTGSVSFSYVMRILGIHPIEAKNMRPDKQCRIYRFASQSLPVDSDGDGEVKNTQYPMLKKYLPPSLIKKDITARRPVVTVRDPQGGADIQFEFVSYSQELQAQAGTERASVWCDESAKQEFYEEQLPRIITSDGDFIVTLTPSVFIGYEYDMIFERAKIYIRTPAVTKRILDRFGKEVPLIEHTNSPEDIAVLCAATDDNPIFNDIVSDKNLKNSLSLTTDEYISDIIGTFDDETVDVRRYGIFRQSSGQIYKDFDIRTHIIDENKYFPDNIPSEWIHARGIDYHEHVPWACGFIAVSPQNECFIYDEFNPSPERIITLEIARVLSRKSKYYNYVLSIIDPHATKTQSNTGLSVVDDLNRAFYEFKRDGISQGGWWRSWDTKSPRGRDEVRKRLKNSRICGRPFNNRITKEGREEYLPTLWVSSSCRETISSFKNWRMEEWGSKEKELSNDKKNTPQTKWSHFPDVYEAIFKESTFRANANLSIRYRETYKEYGQRV